MQSLSSMYPDYAFNLKKFTYSPMPLSYVIAEESIQHSYDIEYTIKSVAHKMAGEYHKDILKQLRKFLNLPEVASPASFFGIDPAAANPAVYMAPAAAWNTPDIDAKAIIAEMAHLSAKYSAPKKPSNAPVLDTLLAVIPGLKDAKADCPANEKCGSEVFHNHPLSKIIIHLNDTHKWTREQIADWLETLDYDLSFQTPEGGEEG